MKPDTRPSLRARRAPRTRKGAPPLLKPDRTQAHRIRVALEQKIVSGALAPGTKLDEETLARRFGASRTPVREALKHLASAQLVELRPHAGAFVPMLSIGDLAELFETMALLEAGCAALASQRHTGADRSALSAAYEACAKAVRNPRQFNVANTRFHECIYRASHNAYLESITLGLRNRLEAYRREASFHPGLIAVALKEHEGILQAILQMDEGEALLRMRSHLDTIRHDAVSIARALARATTANASHAPRSERRRGS